MTWQPPPTWTVGEIVTAAEMQILSDDLNAGAVWQFWTPVLTATVTNPTLGAGYATGQYVQVGKVVTFAFIISFGTGMTPGNGNYNVSMPVAMDVNVPFSLFGSCQLSSSTGGTPANVGTISTCLQTVSATNVQIDVFFQNTPAVPYQQAFPTTHSFPFVWGVNSNIYAWGTYQAA